MLQAAEQGGVLPPALLWQDGFIEAWWIGGGDRETKPNSTALKKPPAAAATENVLKRREGPGLS